MKLQLKHIIPYLDYALMVQVGSKVVEVYSIEAVHEFIGTAEEDSIGIANIKPLLRPLSSLTKQHLIKLFRIGSEGVHDVSSRPKGGWYDGDFRIERFEDTGCKVIRVIPVSDDRYDTLEISYGIDREDLEPPSFSKGELGLRDNRTALLFSVHHQYLLFQKLFEWHFDIFGLIDKDLAIDSTTLKEKV